MVTNYPQEIAATVVAPNAGTQSGSGFSRLVTRMRQFLCGLHGHDSLLHFDHQRISLECASCGYQSPGWELDARRPRILYRGDPQRRQLARPRTIHATERRIA